MDTGIPQLSTPLITFHLAYIDDESPEKTKEVKSLVLPRIGERIIPEAGASQVVVTNVIHKIMSQSDVRHLLVPTVVVQECGGTRQV